MPLIGQADRRVIAPAFGIVLFWLSLFNVALAQVAEDTDIETVVSSTKAKRESKSRDLPEAAAIVVEQTNQFRVQEGLKPVEVNPELANAAGYFARYMASTNTYGHTADGKRPSERAKQHGYDYCLVLENIAYVYSSRGFATEELAKRFVQGWRQSPGHRKNMLNPDATETGVAVAQSEETGYYYAVQMFGRPKSQSIRFEIANESGEEIQYEIGEREFTLPPRLTRTHQRCTTAELSFETAKAKERDKPIRPRDGERFVVLRNASGKIAIERK